MMDFDSLKPWLCLKFAPGLGQKTAIRLLQEYPNPEDYVGQPSHEVYRLSWLSEASRQALASFALPASWPQIQKLIQHYKIGWTTFGSADYPEALASIYTPPIILYYRGDLSVCQKTYRLGVVGTRKPSSYGREMARKLLSPLCLRGLCVVSGLAMGIDTVAHQTALENNSSTIAVLGGGLDSIYPPMNTNLANEISANGVLLSEYEPGMKVEKWNFPARNRLISALSSAIFIVEGALSSGALLTGKFALEQNRDICALPGNINNTNAQGPNYMIKGGARLVTSPEDLMEILAMDEPSPEEQLELFPELSSEEESIFRRLQQASGEISFDELLSGSGWTFGKLSVVLLNLELKGLINKSGGSGYIAVG